MTRIFPGEPSEGVHLLVAVWPDVTAGGRKKIKRLVDVEHSVQLPTACAGKLVLP